MFRRQDALLAQRRGVILLVVVALLTLFAIVGISFVIYANSEAASALFAREAVAPAQPDMDPELALAYFLNQFLFDRKDDPTGYYSSLRGHSLSRSMYGYNSGANIPNNVPFNGTGRFRSSNIPGTFTTNAGAPVKIGPLQETISDYHLINYTYFASDNAVHDPEHPGWYTPGGNQPTYFGGFNVPYTYPDLNSMY
jgi:hypothetical protein